MKAIVLGYVYDKKYQFQLVHAEKWSISGKRKILLWKSSWRKTIIFCFKIIFLLRQWAFFYSRTRGNNNNYYK